MCLNPDPSAAHGELLWHPGWGRTMGRGASLAAPVDQYPGLVLPCPSLDMLLSKHRHSTKPMCPCPNAETSLTFPHTSISYLFVLSPYLRIQRADSYFTLPAQTAIFQPHSWRWGHLCTIAILFPVQCRCRSIRAAAGHAE